MRNKTDKELIRILEFEISNVIANRHMDKEHKAAKIKELKLLICEEKEKSHAKNSV